MKTPIAGKLNSCFGILLSAFIAGVALLPTHAMCQDKGPYRTRISMEAEQFNDNSVLIKAKLTTKKDISLEPVPNALMTFFDAANDEEELGAKKTNSDGFANFRIDDKNKLQKNEDGYYIVSVVFGGDEMHRKQDSEVEFRNGRIEVEAVERDSVKVLLIKAFDADSMLPFSEQSVTIMTPRLFSNLILAEEETDENGEIEYMFTSDVIVNVGKELNIICSMLETDEYGTISAVNVTDWGIPCPVIQERASRKLWSPDAPLWMLITFFILMGLVWGHFGIIAYKLYQVKKSVE